MAGLSPEPESRDVEKKKLAVPPLELEGDEYEYQLNPLGLYDDFLPKVELMKIIEEQSVSGELEEPLAKWLVLNSTKITAQPSDVLEQLRTTITQDLIDEAGSHISERELRNILDLARFGVNIHGINFAYEQALQNWDLQTLPGNFRSLSRNDFLEITRVAVANMLAKRTREKANSERTQIMQMSEDEFKDLMKQNIIDAQVDYANDIFRRMNTEAEHVEHQISSYDPLLKDNSDGFWGQVLHNTLAERLMATSRLDKASFDATFEDSKLGKPISDEDFDRSHMSLNYLIAPKDDRLFGQYWEQISQNKDI